MWNLTGVLSSAFNILLTVCDSEIKSFDVFQEFQEYERKVKIRPRGESESTAVAVTLAA